MTTLFGIAFLLAILALIEGICICTKRKLHTQKQPASCYVLLSALEIRQYCQDHTRFQCGTFSEFQKILMECRFPSKNDCNLSEKIV